MNTIVLIYIISMSVYLVFDLIFLIFHKRIIEIQGEQKPFEYIHMLGAFIPILNTLTCLMYFYVVFMFLTIKGPK